MSEKTIKILLISPRSGIVGGIMRWTNHIAECYSSIKELDQRVDLLFCDFGRKTSGQLFTSKLKKTIAAFAEYLILVKNAIDAIRKNKPDIVHITSPGSFLSVKDFLLLRYARHIGCRTVMHYHFGRIPELFANGGFEYKLLKCAMTEADEIIVIDRKSYETLQNAGFENVHLLPNPVSSMVLELEKKHRGIRITHTVLFVGHVIPTKGVAELVDACRELTGVKLTLLGAVAESYKNELITRAGGEDQSWLDIRGEVDYDIVVSEMCRCSVFVLPTYTEGFPNVVLEAMACGIPIVSTPVGAIPEMLDCRDGKKSGLLVPPKNDVLLKESIERMLNNSDFALWCGETAKCKVRENYTIDKVWQQLTEIWIQSISGE